VAASEKTWAQLEAEIAETFRKWRVHDWDYAIESELANTAAGRRRATKHGQGLDERRVTLRFTFWDRERYINRPVVLTMRREERAVDNLRLLAQAIEAIRMDDVRGITNLVVKLYRQMYPEAGRAAAPPPPHPEPAAARANASPYATLHLAEGAPLAVAEAAYKALVKAAHPDSGGSHTAMVVLNGAIQRIRAGRDSQ
jgi:hypothetical protein